MILAFTEQQKQIIESYGISVVEFKRDFKNLVQWFSEVWKQIKDDVLKIYQDIELACEIAKEIEE